MQECGQTDCCHLLAPLIEAVRISSRDREHIQAADRHLHQQNAASLDVLKEDFDNAVSKGNETQKIQQTEGHICGDRKTTFQHRCALAGQIQCLFSGQSADKVTGKCVLQADAKLVQFHRHDTNERTGKKALQDVNAGSADICPAALVFDCHIKNGNHQSGNKKRPAEQREQPNCFFDPWQIENVSAHIAHHGKKVGNGAIDDLIHPLEYGIKYRIGKLGSKKFDGITDGAANAGDNISKPIEHWVSPSFGKELTVADFSAAAHA